MCLSYFSNSQDISSTLECQQTYLSSDEKIECRFHLHNNGNNPVSISKWFTPLDDVECNYLQVTQNGQKVKYDGISHYRRLPPPSESYITIVPKGKVSTVFDLSKTYRIEEPGTFTVSVDINALYLNTGSPKTSSTLSLRSPSVSFTLDNDKKASERRVEKYCERAKGEEGTQIYASQQKVRSKQMLWEKTRLKKKRN